MRQEDIKAWLKNALIFALPDFLVFMGALSAKFQAEGAIVVVLMLNLLIDLGRKYLANR